MEIKLNLGSGLTNKKDGYVNVDIDEDVHPDIVADVRIIPWVWVPKGDLILIEMNNLAEHYDEDTWLEIVKECHWQLVAGGKLWLKVPFLDTETKDLRKFMDSVLDCFSDLTHKKLPFTIRSFDYLDMNHSRWQKYGDSYGVPKFKRIKQQIKDRFLIVTLEVVK